MLLTRRFLNPQKYEYVLLIALSLSWITTYGVEGNVSNKEKSVKNPHKEPLLCESCHTSDIGSRNNLRFNGNVILLCESCHDGLLTAREIHPVDIAPGKTIAKKIPRDFPLEDGKLTCLTCHDITFNCEKSRSGIVPNNSLLRGDPVPYPIAFCYQCHAESSYQSFNAHDQIEAEKTKTEMCLWCHVRVPDVESRLKEGESYALRSKSFGICNNCHRVSKGHPNDGTHMYAVPSTNMMRYMYAYEMQPRMNLPFNDLLEYVNAIKQVPRSIPLDENGRISCYSCHNPHEKGLLPEWNPRSIGADLKHAVNYRLRAREGVICKACHQK